MAKHVAQSWAKSDTGGDCPVSLEQNIVKSAIPSRFRYFVTFIDFFLKCLVIERCCLLQSLTLKRTCEQLQMKNNQKWKTAVWRCYLGWSSNPLGMTSSQKLAPYFLVLASHRKYTWEQSKQDMSFCHSGMNYCREDKKMMSETCWRWTIRFCMLSDGHVTEIYYYFR